MVRRRKRSRFRLVALLALACTSAATFLLLSPGRHRQHRTALPVPDGCPLGPTTAGIDVSYYQGDIAWSRVRRTGVRFAFIRAYDGLDVFDSRFTANWTEAKSAGVLRGAYQFFRPELPAIDQADLLIAALRTHGTGELPPVLDIETTGGLALADVAARAQQWIARVRAELKVEPIVYTNPGMWRATGVPASLTAQPLWVAHYTTQCPEIPRSWARWAIWQYSESGRVPGISTPVDLNVFDGSVEDLARRFGR